MKKIISFLLVAAMLFSMLPLSVFSLGVIIDEVTSIEYKTEHTVFTEGLDGEWDTQNDYYRYICNFHEGDELTVYYSESAPVVFVANWVNGEICFTADGKQPIKQWEDIFTSNDQNKDNQWTPGNKYSYFVWYEGKQTEVGVTVIANPVDSIEYIPESPIVCYFEKNGMFEIDALGQDYFRYWVIRRSTDDILRVNYNDGRGTVEYRLTFDPEEAYVSLSDPSDVISPDRVRMEERQYDEHYTVNGENYLYVSYMGKEARIPVSVLENPVEYLYYYPGGSVDGSVQITEEKDGEWRENEGGEQYFYYDTPWFKVHDQIVVKFTDKDEPVTYTYLNKFDPETGANYFNFYDESDNELPDYQELRLSRDGDVIWTTEGENFMYAIYKDTYSSPIRVVINANPVKAIIFERSEDVIKIVEGTNQYYNGGDGRYYYSVPYYREGDKLIVVDNEDNEIVYNYKYGTFVSEDNSKFINSSDVWMHGDQKEPWGKGEHKYTVEYSGRTYELTLEIIENPVLSIEYKTVKQPYNIYEETNGDYDEQGGYYRYYYSWYEDGDILTVEYNDERGKVDYEYKRTGEDGWTRAFIAADGSRIESNEVWLRDDQETNHWERDKENYIRVEYSGKEYNIRVNIIENPIKGINFVPSKTPTVMAGVNCWFDDELGYNIYETPRFNRGDKLVISYKNEPDKEYTADYDEYGEMLFTADDGDVISGFDIGWYSDQHMDGGEWTVGGDNYYYIDYLGYTCKVDCEMIGNAVESIGFIPHRPASYIDGQGGYYDEMDDRYYYEPPRVGNGDTLIVHYNDERGLVTYTAKYDNELDRMTFVSETDVIVEDEWFEYRDEQNMFMWEVDGENNYWYVYYCGAEAKVPVTVRANNIKSISYQPVQPVQVYIDDYRIVTDEKTGEQYKEYSLPDLYDGDKVIITYDDESQKEFTLTFDDVDGEHYFVNDIDDEAYHKFTFMPFDNQYEQEWTVDGENYFSVDFYGHIADIPVQIITTDVKSIEFVPQKEIVIVENTGGDYLNDDEGNRFYYYRGDSIVMPGDKLVVTYNDESVVEYFLIIDEENETWALRSEDGKELVVKDLDFEEDQYENHWMPGKNYFVIKYQGVRTELIEVTIKPDVAYVPGDIDGDEETTNQDLILLFQYLSGWDVEDKVNTPALDVDGDGEITNQDLILLFQYLSGWAVEIH